MVFAGTNYLAIVIATVVAWISGAVWYHGLTRPWLAAQGKTIEQFRAERAATAGRPAAYLPFVIVFVAELIMAWVLAGTLGHLGPGQVTLRNGIITAVFLWLGFVITTIAVNYTFSGRSPLLMALDGGHWLLVMLLMGAIIGWMGV